MAVEPHLRSSLDEANSPSYSRASTPDDGPDCLQGSELHWCWDVQWDNGCIHTLSFSSAFSWMEPWERTHEHTLTLLVSFLGHGWPPAVLAQLPFVTWAFLRWLKMLMFWTPEGKKTWLLPLQKVGRNSELKFKKWTVHTYSIWSWPEEIHHVIKMIIRVMLWCHCSVLIWEVLW